MFANYLKTAIRSILRERYYALIKIIGLALGLGTSLVLMLYVTHQLSYDSYHPDVDRMYRVNQTNIWDPAGSVFGSTGPAVSFALAEDFPEIEEILRINTPGGYTVRYTTKEGIVLAFNEDNVLASDSNFFSFFAFKLKEGDVRTALNGNGKVVISEETALKLFGDEPALGKIIQLGDDRISVEVTGVTEKQPENTHFQFDYLLSMPTNPNVKRFEWSWIWTQVVTYVKLRPGADVTALNKKLKTFADKHAPNTFKILHMDYKEFLKDKGEWQVYLQPVRDIYLYSGPQEGAKNPIGNRIGATSDIKYVYILGIIASFILLIAVINFVNLSTARASKRAKEVGVKKTLGLMRGSLIAQFQTEHILITMVSMLFGLGVMELLRLLIQPLVDISIPITVWSPAVFISIIIALPLVIGFVAGLYPSFYLTAFRPAEVLKGKLATGFGSSGLRNGLVVFQFTISIALMASTLIIFNQLNFFLTQSVGFEKDNLLVINNADKLGKQLESFREEIAQYSGVKSVSISGDIGGGFEDIFMKEGDQMKLSISQIKIDEHFFTTTGMSLASGRTFDINRPSDKTAVIINNTTAKFFGWTPEDALGKHILYMGDDIGPQEVIGVVNDFHFQSLHQSITPLMFFNTKSNFYGDGRIVMVKYNTREVQQLLSHIEQRWNQLADATPFSSYFYEEELKNRYKQEQRMGSLFSIFTGLSITIAIIGLVALVSYSAEQRKKEIGVRKVFGASMTNIYVMVNKQYIRLLLVAFVIATPLTWWMMNKWLSSYAYRQEITPGVFVLAGLAELVIALVCVGYLALKAASVNPAHVLKEE